MVPKVKISQSAKIYIDNLKSHGIHLSRKPYTLSTEKQIKTDCLKNLPYNNQSEQCVWSQNQITGQSEK